MKKPTKKQVIILAGVAVIAICAAGWMMLGHEAEVDIPKKNAVVVHDVKPIIEKAMEKMKQEEKEKQEKEKQEKERKEKEKQKENSSKEVVQSIAPEPEVPQEENVQAPPVQPSEPSGGNGNSGDKGHEGMIWVDGFGWIKDDGGGSEGEYADDMIPNGNQIGDMN